MMLGRERWPLLRPEVGVQPAFLSYRRGQREPPSEPACVRSRVHARWVEEEEEEESSSADELRKEIVVR